MRKSITNPHPPTMMPQQPMQMFATSSILLKILGGGHKVFEGDSYLQTRLGMMKMFLWYYTQRKDPLRWVEASLTTAEAFQKGPHAT